MPEIPFKSKVRYEDVTQSRASSKCILCRGTKFLCGKSRCPVLVRSNSMMKTLPLLESLSLDGSSPPSVFVGRMGYPKVDVGPMVPPISGDTSLMDTPELWIGKSIEEIVGFRSSLVRGKHPVRVTEVEDPSKIIVHTRELAMAAIPIDVEATFLKKPYGGLTLNDEVQPHGPSAPLRSIQLGNIKIDQRIDRAHFDTDLKAKDAVVTLYENKVLISQIQKAFSVGAFGQKKRRRFVPTRWSITAVDSTLGEELMNHTRLAPWINDYRVYESYQLDNRWIILMMPMEWCYELIEAWYPNTTWNPFGKQISIYGSYEFHEGRKKYAEIGGCYYAARLAVNELLTKERRQAGVVILREAHPGYILPVGVWNVRENVRAALKTKPRTFSTLKDALDYSAEKLDIPMKRWILNSGILKHKLFQRKLTDFIE